MKTTTFDLLRDDLMLETAKAFRVPMSMIDGRPWVATEAEADAEPQIEAW